MVASICATFMIGPLRPPNADFSSRAVRSLKVLTPKSRPPAARAAMPPTAGTDLRIAPDATPETVGFVVFRRRFSGGSRGALLAHSIASSSSMKPRITESPLSQKAGSDASSPKGASNSLWRSVPPASSIRR